MSQLPHYVIDANVYIKTVIPDPLSPKVDQLLALLGSAQIGISVPDLFYIECTNILWKYIRAKLYSASDLQPDITELKTLNLHSVPTATLVETAFQIAVTNTISAYDACYVALAQQVDAPLLTLDERLFNALSSSSYNVQLFRDFELPRFP